MTSTAAEVDWLANRPESAEAVMLERARALAAVPAEAPSASDVLSVVTFGLGGEQFAIETHCVRSVVANAEITPVPGTPPFLLGVANLRGEVLAILDLNQVLGAAGQAAADGIPSSSATLLVLGTRRAEFGIVADEVFEICSLPRDTLLAPTHAAGAGREYVRGVTAQALLVLDGDALLADESLFIDESE